LDKSSVSKIIASPQEMGIRDIARVANKTTFLSALVIQWVMPYITIVDKGLFAYTTLQLRVCLNIVIRVKTSYSHKIG